MTKETIWTTVTDIFREVFEDEQLTIHPQTNASDIEDWDSLAQINLLVAMEHAFHVKFPMNEIKSLQNVGEMVDLIAGKLEIK